MMGSCCRRDWAGGGRVGWVRVAVAVGSLAVCMVADLFVLVLAGSFRGVVMVVAVVVLMVVAVAVVVAVVVVGVAMGVAAVVISQGRVGVPQDQGHQQVEDHTRARHDEHQFAVDRDRIDNAQNCLIDKSACY